MSGQSTYVIWFATMDSLVVLLALIAILRLRSGLLRSIYLAFLAFGALWVNLIYTVKWIAMPESIAVMLSRAIFVSILFTLCAFVCFMIAFCDLKEEFRKARFFAFVGANALLILGTLLGYVENGVHMTATGLAPVYGPLHPVLVGSNLVWGVYVFWLVIREFRKSTDPIFRSQLRILFACCLFTFAWAGTMNGILPVLLGSSAFSHLGPLGFLVLYAGIIWIILEERTLFIARDFRALLKLPAFQTQSNVMIMKQLFLDVEDAVTRPTSPFRKSYLFHTGQGEADLTVSHGTGAAIQAPGALLPGNMEGFTDNLRALETQNRRLTFALLEAQSRLRDPELGATIHSVPPRIPSSASGPYRLSDFVDEIEVNKRDMRESYGFPFPCFSRARVELLTRIRMYAPSLLTPLFVGPPASGRTTFSRVMHSLRSASSLREVSCASTDAGDLRPLVREFLSPSCESTGILIRELHLLDPSGWPAIEQLLTEKRAGKWVYFTAEGEGLAELLSGAGAHRATELLQLQLSVPALCSSREEMFFLALDLIRTRSRLLGRGIDAVSRTWMDRLISRPWPGNYAEFAGVIDRALVESDSSIVDGSLPKLPAQATARKLEKAQAIPDLAHLTPLENAERRTIYEHLVANNFNQRKTSEEIGIRPNTLIAKMRKYEIAPPGGARPGRPRLNR
jgi:hypothetical protein